MAVLYTLSHVNDVYTLENINANTITYRLNRLECDEEVTFISQAVILAGDEVVLPIKIDGLYEVVISDGVTDATLPRIEYYVKQFDLFIAGAEEILCGCAECGGCEECNTCEQKLNIMTQGLAILGMHQDLYGATFLSNLTQIECDMSQFMANMLTCKYVNGKTIVSDIYLRMIAVLYMTFYFSDFEAVSASKEQEEYVNEKFNAVKILKCIKKLGIDTEQFD